MPCSKLTVTASTLASNESFYCRSQHMSFTHALKWSFLSELAAKAIQPVVFIVIAQLLTPEDFGVMTAAMMVIAFSQIFWEAGMGKALIQRQTHIAEAANAAFMINIGLGVMIAAVIYLFAQPIAQTFFQDDRVTAVLQVMTLQVVLGALGSVQTALLQKEMGFKKLFWIRFATISLPGLASIPLAMNGWGYWALVAGTLTGQFAQVIMLWRLSKWFPGALKNRSITNELVKFGAWVSMSGVLAWYYNWADIFFIGKYLGLNVVGEYRVATQLNVIAYSTIFSPLIQVIYAHLSKSIKESRTISDLIPKLPIAAVWLSLPVGLIFCLLSNEIVQLFLGEKWVGTIKPLEAVAIIQAVGYLSGFNGEIYRVLGRPDLEGRVWLLGIFLYTPTYYFLSQISIDAFLLGRIVLVALFSLVHLFLFGKVLSVSIGSIWFAQAKVALALIICAVLTALFTNMADLHGFNKMICTVFLFLSGAATAFYFFERPRLLTLLPIINK